MADGSSGRCTGSTKRAANLSSSERQLLTELAMTRADVIENKRTDGATTREKEAAWVTLAAEFNAASTEDTCDKHNHCHRPDSPPLDMFLAVHGRGSCQRLYYHVQNLATVLLRQIYIQNSRR